MTLASWPTSTSVWKPALSFVGSYGLSSTSASAFSVKVFCCRSYSRPTMVVPTLWPEYEYDPSANPVSLNPASVVSRWFTGGAGFCAPAALFGLHHAPPARSAGVRTALSWCRLLQGPALHRVRGHRRDGRGVDFSRADTDDALERLHEDLAVADLPRARGRENRLDRRLHERIRARHLEPHFLPEFEHHGPATIVLQHLVFAAVTTHPADGDAGDAGAEQGGLHLRQPLGADHRGDQLHVASSSLRSLPVQVRAARPATTRRPTR